MPKKNCDGKMEIYSRVVGFYRPLQNWNEAKEAEYKDRKEYKLKPEKGEFHE